MRDELSARVLLPRVVCAVLCAAGCSGVREFSDSYVVDSHYATLEDAKRDGAIMRGWLPEYLPASSREIDERHSCDTNEVWARFWIDVNDLDAITKVCQQIDAGVVQLPLAPNRFPHYSHIDWWPSDLKARDPLFTFYESQSSKAFLAIDRASGLIYYWSLSF